jgi:hypothetical protein
MRMPTAADALGAASLPVAELRKVVEFDAIWQLDRTANWIQWHLVHPYDQRQALRMQPMNAEGGGDGLSAN